jgi:hypothetical protein
MGNNSRSRAELLPEQSSKFIYAKSCLPDNCSQDASVDFFVIRHSDLCKWMIATQDHVAALPAHNAEVCFLERFHTLVALDYR